MVIMSLPFDSKIIVMGDFNLSKACFISNSDGLQLYEVHSKSSEAIYDFFFLRMDFFNIAKY